MSLIAENRALSFCLGRGQSRRGHRSGTIEARWAAGMIGATSLIFFAVGWLRYYCFRAGVSDLGVFDQAAFLISRGRGAFLPILGYPILADHAAIVLYPLTLLYVIYPSILWLIATQSAALAIGGWYIWRLARQAGVQPRWALILCATWLAYPALAIPNLRDFHPEILAVPAILAAVFYARDRRPICFLVCLIIALGTKEVVAVTVAAMGLWLFLSEEKRGYGLTAMILSVIWFVLATRFIIPLIGQGHQLNGYRFFGYLGKSPAEILRTILLHPLIPLRFVLSAASGIYLLALSAPVWWGLRPGRLTPLLGAVPCLAINLLSDNSNFHNAFYHYSLMIVPFMFLAIISTLAAGEAWLSRPWMVGTWLTLTMTLAGALQIRHAIAQQSPDQPSRAALAALVDMVDDAGGVLSTHQLTTHLMHRDMAYYVFDPAEEPGMHLPPPGAFDWVLLDFHEPSLIQTGDFGREILRQYQSDPKFVQLRGSDGLYLFHRRKVDVAESLNSRECPSPDWLLAHRQSGDGRSRVD